MPNGWNVDNGARRRSRLDGLRRDRRSDIADRDESRTAPGGERRRSGARGYRRNRGCGRKDACGGPRHGRYGQSIALDGGGGFRAHLPGRCRQRDLAAPHGLHARGPEHGDARPIRLPSPQPAELEPALRDRPAAAWNERHESPRRSARRDDALVAHVVFAHAHAGKPDGCAGLARSIPRKPIAGSGIARLERPRHVAGRKWGAHGWIRRAGRPDGAWWIWGAERAGCGRGSHGLWRRARCGNGRSCCARDGGRGRRARGGGRLWAIADASGRSDVTRDGRVKFVANGG